MMFTRRSFLTGAVLAGGSLLVGSAIWPSSANSDPRKLKIPELIDARNQRQSIALIAQAGKTSESNRVLRRLHFLRE